jgi:putative heme-binding domain-containing protein
MKNGSLQSEHVLPFLNDEDRAMRSTGLWVASHHPEWSAPIAAFLSRELAGTSPDAGDGLHALLVAFCGDANVQNLIATHLTDGNATEAKQLYLIDAMSACTLDATPSSWTAAIGTLLDADATSVRSKAVSLIRLLGLTDFSDPLAGLAADTAQPITLRIAALGAYTSMQPNLNETQFQFLTDALTTTNDASVRRETASVLESATLNETQQLHLAETILPGADAFLLSRLLDVFKDEQPVDGAGLALVEALTKTPETLDALTQDEVQAFFGRYSDAVQQAASPLLEQMIGLQNSRLQRLQELESNLSGGDMARGRALYFGKAACWSCHSIGGEGGNLGPDLTSIGQVRSVHDVLEAIVYPSVSFVREYETYKVTTSGGEYLGLIEDQTPDVVVLRSAPDASLRIPRTEISSMTRHPVSLMPQGLDALLTVGELADLMTFLMGQDQDPDRDKQFLR